MLEKHKYSIAGRRMQQPLEHPAEQQGIHYRSQLSAYRYLLEKYYAKHVVGNFAACECVCVCVA